MGTRRLIYMSPDRGHFILHNFRPPINSIDGFINGQFYYLTASSDESGTYLDYNYFGLTAGQIETLGLPTEIDLASTGPGGNTSAAPNKACSAPSMLRYANSL
jgi:hypothetical protein